MNEEGLCIVHFPRNNYLEWMCTEQQTFKLRKGKQNRGKQTEIEKPRIITAHFHTPFSNWFDNEAKKWVRSPMAWSHSTRLTSASVEQHTVFSSAHGTFTKVDQISTRTPQPMSKYWSQHIVVSDLSGIEVDIDYRKARGKSPHASKFSSTLLKNSGAKKEISREIWKIDASRMVAKASGFHTDDCAVWGIRTDQRHMGFWIWSWVRKRPLVGRQHSSQVQSFYSEFNCY